jgi:hypothetical protein
MPALTILALIWLLALAISLQGRGQKMKNEKR